MIKPMFLNLKIQNGRFQPSYKLTHNILTTKNCNNREVGSMVCSDST